MEFSLEGHEYIELQALLKACSLCESGGAAKHAIVNGNVKVDGVVEVRRGRKIRAGQTVNFEESEIQVKE
jgi:ribosome-associated protein